MLVNLIETPAGYSIIEGTELLNRPPPSHTPPINSPPINNSTILNGAPIPIIKEQKFVMKRTSKLNQKKISYSSRLQQSHVLKTMKWWVQGHAKRPENSLNHLLNGLAFSQFTQFR